MADALASNKKFRINAKSIFGTVPHCDVSPADVLDRCIQRWGADAFKYVCISTEDHADGTPHLHFVLAFKAKVDIKNVAILDELTGKHGNYQTVRSLKDVVDYVKKGLNFKELGTFEASQETKGSIIAKRIREGGTLFEVEELDPAYFMMHMRQIKEYKSFISIKQQSIRQRPAPIIINQWRSLFAFGFPRVFKECQYWVYGSANTGKTSMILDLLSLGFLGYLIPKNDDHAHWEDNHYDFAYIDEFKGQLTIQFLNEFLQGSSMHLNTKGGSKIKTQNLPTVILSNYSPTECYSKTPYPIVNTLISRLIVVETF